MKIIQEIANTIIWGEGLGTRIELYNVVQYSYMIAYWHFIIGIVLIILPCQIEADAYQEDLGFSTGQLGKGGVAGPVRGPTVDKKTQVSISKRLQVLLLQLSFHDDINYR